MILAYSFVTIYTVYYFFLKILACVIVDAALVAVNWEYLGINLSKTHIHPYSIINLLQHKHRHPYNPIPDEDLVVEFKM